MKFRVLTLLLVLLAVLTSGAVYAENLQSPNFILVDPEIGSTAGTSASTNYASLSLSSGGITYSEISSSLYRIGSGHGYTFMANAPYIKCFETTTTSITTQCTELPHANGAVGECGEAGCYDRAIVQIDGGSNPTDTVYSIEISDDNWTTIYILDGTTHTKKPISSKTIADYKTIAGWSVAPFDSTNVRGLAAGKQYSIRATALQGDFTESPAGPSISATTTFSTAVFDLDIGADLTADTNAPYAVALQPISPESYSFTSTNNVIVEFSTNAQLGAEVYVKDLYSGLRSTSTLYLLQSSSEDLALPASDDGFGLQSTTTSQDAGSLGLVKAGAQYSVVGTNVGAVSPVDTLLACSLTSLTNACGVGTPAWVKNGEILTKVGARASLSAPAKDDYQDVLTFTLIAGY